MMTKMSHCRKDKYMYEYLLFNYILALAGVDVPDP